MHENDEYLRQKFWSIIPCLSPTQSKWQTLLQID